jgi:glycosyltransferase involved in cell wall biosynthesis
MKRVLVIEGSGNLRGSERALLDMLKDMPTFEVAVCCPPKRPLNFELEKLGVRIYPYFVYGLHEKSRWHRLLAAIGVLRACLEFRADIIHLNQSGSYRVALPAAVLLNLPIVAHVRLFEDAAYLARRHPNPRRLRCLIAISLSVKEEIQRFPELKAIPLHWIYDAYARSPQPRLQTSAERIANRIACVGRLEPNKGQDVLIDALSLLKKLGGGLECLIVGEGEECFVQGMTQRASKADITSLVRWLGFVRDIVPLLQTCSVLVCPSHLEALGRVIFEAWDAGAIPVVFSGSGGAAEIVAAAQGGMIYEEQTAESLASTIRAALQLDHVQAARLVNNGRAWMTKNCNPRAYGEAVSSILLRACSAPRSP